MDIISWQEIAVRLSFASILGSSTAIAKRWYRTKEFIQSNTLMALGTGVFSILASLTSETKFLPQLILGISIICAGVGLSKKKSSQSINIDAIMRLWCAGAVGLVVGLGFFIPAYVSILIIFLINILLPTPETNFIPDLEKELNYDSASKTRSEKTLKPSVAKEITYRCHVNCLAVDEAEVLALLVQLAKKQKLVPTKISSKNLVNESNAAEIEIQVEFISEGKNSPLQLQQVLMNLKSKLRVSSASWLNISPELNSKSEEILQEN